VLRGYPAHGKKAGRSIAGPRNRIHDIATAKDQIVGREAAARCEYPMHFGVESGTISDVHRDVLQEHYIKCRIFEWQLEGVPNLKTDAVREAAATRQIDGRLNEPRAQIDADHVAAKSGGYRPCRSANTAANIQYACRWLNSSRAGQFGCGEHTSDMELVEGREFVDGQRLPVRHDFGERRLDPAC
jgi:hypothetical protein